MLMSHPKTLFVRFASRHHALVRYGAVVLAKQRMTKNECLKQLFIWASNLIWPRKAPLKEAFVAIVLGQDRKSTRLNSSHVAISYAVFCLKKKKKKQT